MSGAAKRVRLEDLAPCQGASGVGLARDSARPVHDTGDRCDADWVEQLLLQTPRKGLGPAE